MKVLTQQDFLRLRKFSEYSAYLMEESDKRWDLFADKDVVPTSVFREILQEHFDMLKSDPLNYAPKCNDKLKERFGVLFK